jgi:general secretion pathway protein H
VLRSAATGREVAMPADVDVRANVTADCQTSSGAAGFAFYPDGRACGGTLTLAGAGGGYDVRVNWLTGGVEVVANP